MSKAAKESGDDNIEDTSLEEVRIEIPDVDMPQVRTREQILSEQFDLINIGQLRISLEYSSSILVLYGEDISNISRILEVFDSLVENREVEILMDLHAVFVLGRALSHEQRVGEIIDDNADLIQGYEPSFGENILVSMSKSCSAFCCPSMGSTKQLSLLGEESVGFVRYHDNRDGDGGVN